ncbi:MAG: efflux RND transporter periplasmic adaptor subunit [Proteobacteria bacterium]|nr:efflux RND transporter periplasmic adaptor subunit [Pseudomonadota bacterium]
MKDNNRFTDFLKAFAKGEWKIPVIALIGLLFAIHVASVRPAPAPKTPLIEPPQSSFTRNVSGIGVVEPKSELISVGVELPGVVRQIPVKVGDTLKAGDVLFVMDERDIDAQIAVLEKALASAIIQGKDAAQQFAIAKNIGDNRAISKDEFNRRNYASQLSASRIEEIKAQLDQARTTKDRLTVKAPIDGRILELNIHLGEYANLGDLAGPLILMGDINPLYVRVEIDEENAKSVKENAEAFGYKRGDTEVKIPLQFVRIEPRVKPKQNLAIAGQRVDTRVLQILYALPEDGANMYVGQQMDVFINKEQEGS